MSTFQPEEIVSFSLPAEEKEEAKKPGLARAWIPVLWLHRDQPATADQVTQYARLALKRYGPGKSGKESRIEGYHPFSMFLHQNGTGVRLGLRTNHEDTPVPSLRLWLEWLSLICSPHRPSTINSRGTVVLDQSCVTVMRTYPSKDLLSLILNWEIFLANDLPVTKFLTAIVLNDQQAYGEDPPTSPQT